MTKPSRRWVATSTISLRELVGREQAAAAVAHGRLFVDGRRELDAARLLEPGAVVELFDARTGVSIEVLLRDVEGVWAVYKPPALPTEPDATGMDSVVTQLAERAGVEARSVFAASRLDVGVSGVLLAATTETARLRLLSERATSNIRRRYVAIASGVPAPPAGKWSDPLGRQGSGRRAVEGMRAQPALTEYRILSEARAVGPGKPPCSLLVLTPRTGRMHQLRVHAAAHGVPLLGDRKYGGPPRFTSQTGQVTALSRVLLHSACVEWGQGADAHRVACPPPADFDDVWLALDGDAVALAESLDGPGASN